MKRFIQQDSCRHRDDTVMTYRNELYSVYAFEITREEGMEEVQFGKIRVEGNPWNNGEVLCVVDKQEYIEHEGNSRSFAGQSSSSQTDQCKKIKYFCITLLFFLRLHAALAWTDALGSRAGESAIKMKFSFVLLCEQRKISWDVWKNTSTKGNESTPRTQEKCLLLKLIFFLQNHITMPFLHVFNEKCYWW